MNHFITSCHSNVCKASLDKLKNFHPVFLHIAVNIRPHLRSGIKNQVFGTFATSLCILCCTTNYVFTSLFDMYKQGRHSCICKKWSSRSSLTDLKRFLQYELFLTVSFCVGVNTPSMDKWLFHQSSACCAGAPAGAVPLSAGTRHAEIFLAFIHIHIFLLTHEGQCSGTRTTSSSESGALAVGQVLVSS